jgi:coiled-coil domain-containing protein 61
MLNSAFKCETEQVYIDLLTFQDLENLKNKNKGSSMTNNTSVNTTQTNNKKRYMILTYVGEFERVHYPLPLNFIEEPEPDSLRRTIERMKNQIVMQKSNTFSV